MKTLTDEIKVGDKFLCVEDVVMNTGRKMYTKGNIYTSEEDECITNDDGDKYHRWSFKNEMNECFERMGKHTIISENEIFQLLKGLEDSVIIKYLENIGYKVTHNK